MIILIYLNRKMYSVPGKTALMKITALILRWIFLKKAVTAINGKPNVSAKLLFH